MAIRIATGILLGGGLGVAVGYGMKCAGGTCPLTCNPWGGAITGIVFGLIWALG